MPPCGELAATPDSMPVPRVQPQSLNVAPAHASCRRQNCSQLRRSFPLPTLQPGVWGGVDGGGACEAAARMSLVPGRRLVIGSLFTSRQFGESGSLMRLSRISAKGAAKGAAKAGEMRRRRAADRRAEARIVLELGWWVLITSFRR